MSAEIAVAVSVGIAASVEDLFRRRISNWIPLAALLAGIACLAFSRGWLGALSAFGGAVSGFLVFLVFYWLGGMGGGDVKLMAGFGALLGIERVLEAALWTAACGGILAALVVLGAALRNKLLQPAGRTTEVSAIPYAPAIALGTWLALLPKP
jgi:prepilin peptidase CpaA